MLIGAALAPTDPAVTFSVLAGKEVGGRTGTILEGEAGFNDPVGIALMIGMIELATDSDASVADVAFEFLREMGIGLALGAVAGALMLHLLRRVRLPDPSLYPLAVLLAAAVVYGGTTVLHGSGFLAVFVAGIVIGDADFPRRIEVRHFHAALADLGELAVFVVLGLTIDLSLIFAGALWWQGIVLAVLLGFVVRPLVVAPLILPARLEHGERLFVMFAGLKGAVPILLASLAVVGNADQSAEIYGIVFVVVLFSVAVQGSLVPSMADRLGVPMVDADAEARTCRSRGRSCGRTTRIPHCHEPRRRRHAGLAKPLVERLRRVHVDVDPDEVDQGAGAHRPARAVLQRGVEVFGSHPRLVEHTDAIVEERDQDAVDDEPRSVMAADDLLAERAPTPAAASTASSELSSAWTISTSGISGAGLKKCIPTTRSGEAVAAAISVTESAEVFVARIASGRQIRSSSANSSTLRLELLDDRLDHEVAAREHLEIRRGARVEQSPRRDAPASADPSRPCGRGSGRSAEPRPPRARRSPRGRSRRSRPRPRAARSRRPWLRARPPRSSGSPAPLHPTLQVAASGRAGARRARRQASGGEPVELRRAQPEQLDQVRCGPEGVADDGTRRRRERSDDGAVVSAISTGSAGTARSARWASSRIAAASAGSAVRIAISRRSPTWRARAVGRPAVIRGTCGGARSRRSSSRVHRRPLRCRRGG